MESTSLQLFQETIFFDQQNIYLKPICDYFKISYENTQRKINNDPIMANHSTKKSNGSLFGDNYPRLLVDKIGFVRWIQLINANTIDESVREKFKIFQELSLDYLYGSLEERRLASIHHTRLKKLKSLYGKIGAEIQRVSKELQGYYDNQLLITQTSLKLNA